MKQTPKTTKTGEKPIAQELNQDNLDNILAKQIQKSVIEPLKIYDEENTDRAIELETSFSIEEFKSGLRNEKFLDEIIEFTNEYLRQREIGWIKKDFRGPMFKLAEPESIAALTDGLISYYSKLREKGAGHLDLSILHNAKVLGFALKNELDNKKAIILMEKAGLDQDKELKYVSESINLFTYDALSFVFEKGKPEAREFISNQFDLLMTKGTIRNLDSLVEKIISSPSVYFKDELARLILNSLSEKLYEARQELQKFGFKPEEVDNVIEYWDKSFADATENILIMRAVEYAVPGGAKILHDEFGIKEFRRYPAELLISQLKERNIDQPYGIILLPRADHNGSFDNDVKIYKKLYQETRGHHGIRVTEAGTRFEIGRRLLGLDKKYGAKNKIDFAIIGGHGEEDKINFGQGLDMIHFEGKGIKRTREFFSKEPSIILFSCSTGAIGGLAEKIRDTFESTTIIAPDQPTGVADLDVVYTGNHPTFEVEYKEAEAKKFIPK